LVFSPLKFSKKYAGFSAGLKEPVAFFPLGRITNNPFYHLYTVLGIRKPVPLVDEPGCDCNIPNRRRTPEFFNRVFG